MSAITRITPFLANKGFNPRMSFEPADSHPRAISPADVLSRMEKIWQYLQEEIGLAQTRMEGFANAHRKLAPAYQVDDLVWLNTKNLRTERPSKKLDYKQIGPFKVLQRVGLTSYKLELPPSVKLHPVFHSSLYNQNPAIHRFQVKSTPRRHRL